jgi:hypothetical protein
MGQDALLDLTNTKPVQLFANGALGKDGDQLDCVTSPSTSCPRILSEELIVCFVLFLPPLQLGR